MEMIKKHYGKLMLQNNLLLVNNIGRPEFKAVMHDMKAVGRSTGTHVRHRSTAEPSGGVLYLALVY